MSTCPTCTFMNYQGAKNCEVCEGPIVIEQKAYLISIIEDLKSSMQKTRTKVKKINREIRNKKILMNAMCIAICDIKNQEAKTILEQHLEELKEVTNTNIELLEATMEGLSFMNTRLNTANEDFSRIFERDIFQGLSDEEVEEEKYISEDD